MLRSTINDYFRNRKWAKQRAKRGFADIDVWEIDTWFLEIMPKMLQQLLDHHSGYPTRFLEEFYKDRQEELKKYDVNEFVHFYPTLDEKAKKLHEECQEWADKRWCSVLQEMIHLFKEANEDTCSHKNPYEEDYHTALYAFYEVYGHNGEKLKGNEKVEVIERPNGKREKVCSPIKPYWFEELNEENKRISELFRAEEKQIYEYRNECKTKALSMFVEYFDNLWD